MKAKKLFEKDTSSLKDGGFIFQAIISHNLSFDIKDGYVYLSAATSYPFDKSRINAKLHQVDLFPDLKTSGGTASLTYVVLSEVNNLARKFELAAEVIKRNFINPSVEMDASKILSPDSDEDEVKGGGVPQLTPPQDETGGKVNIHYNKPKELEAGKSKITIDITPQDTGKGPNPQLTPPGLNQGASNPSIEGPKGNLSINPPVIEAKENKVKVFYKDEVEKLEKAGKLTRKEIKRLNEIFFKETFYKVSLNTSKLHLREISTSSLDAGSPEIVLKISTSLKDEAFGGKVPALENFSITVSGSASISKKGKEVATLSIFDPIEKRDDLIFQTIIPSLVLRFQTDKVPIETFSNKSSEIAATQSISYEDIFQFDKMTDEEQKKLDDINTSKLVIPSNDVEEVEAEVIEKLSMKIEYAKQLINFGSNVEKETMQIDLEKLSKKLYGAKKIYESLGKSLYVKQELSILKREIEQLYTQISHIF